MSKITITYLGHSCFRIEKDGYSVVLDPYKQGSVPGVELPENLCADRVICSHGHGDHNAAERVTLIEGNKPSMKAEFITVPHDDAEGTKRGMNSIAVLDTGSVRLVHFGDIGRLCTEEEYAELGHPEIVMIPVGGFYTIDAVQAKEITERLQPKLTVLMHYRNGEAGYDVLSSLEDVKKVFTTTVDAESTVSFDESEIPSAVYSMKAL